MVAALNEQPALPAPPPRPRVLSVAYDAATATYAITWTPDFSLDDWDERTARAIAVVRLGCLRIEIDGLPGGLSASAAEQIAEDVADDYGWRVLHGYTVEDSAVRP